MLTATIPDKVSVDDLKALDPLEAAFKAQREYNALDKEMKMAKERRAFTRSRLIADLEGRGRTEDGSDNGKVKLMRELKNQVTDHEALLEYVYGLDEPVSTYLEERFRKGNKAKGIEDPLDRLIREAAEKAMSEGKSVKDCLPPGLTVRNVVTIRVTLRKDGGEKKLTETEKLMQQIDAELE